MSNISEGIDPMRVQEVIREVCSDLADFLVEKNESYGNSALDPIRIFSNASQLEGVRVRIDDKLNRILRGKQYVGDDDVKDLAGYLIIHMVGERLGIK